MRIPEESLISIVAMSYCFDDAASELTEIALGQQAGPLARIPDCQPSAGEVRRWRAANGKAHVDHIGTEAFDVCQLAGRFDDDTMSRLKEWARRERKKEGTFWRDMLVFDSQAPCESAPFVLFDGVVGESMLPVLAELAGTGSVILGSQSLVDYLEGAPIELLHQSTSVFAARVKVWDDSLSEFVFGVAGGTHTVVLGLFESDNAVKLACEELSSQAVLLPSMLDMTVVETLGPLSAHSRWSVVLNQGDKLCEDAVFGICSATDSASLSKLSDILQSNVSLRIEGKPERLIYRQR